MKNQSARGRRGGDAWCDVSPEERVRAAVSMTNVVTKLCIESIREREPTISEEELIRRARARFTYGREPRRQA